MRLGSSLRGWALGYAERAWPVLPLVPHQKRPLTKNGLLDASIDPRVIEGWWSRWPTANIGLRTGMQFDVLDIDGEVGRASLEAKVGPGAAHPGPISRTGKGEHWLYLPNGTANRAGLLPKVDWRGTNGYIVAPPSIHPDGHLYEWVEGHDHTASLPPTPDWLTPLLSEYVEPAPRSEVVLKSNPYGTDIVQVAERKQYHVRRDGGGRYAIACPYHDGDREPSLKLYPNNTFYCFGCGAYGDMFDLLNGNARYKYAKG